MPTTRAQKKLATISSHEAVFADNDLTGLIVNHLSDRDAVMLVTSNKELFKVGIHWLRSKEKEAQYKVLEQEEKQLWKRYWAFQRIPHDVSFWEWYIVQDIIENECHTALDAFMVAWNYRERVKNLHSLCLRMNLYATRRSARLRMIKK